MNSSYFDCLAEECAEVIKAIMKANRFGIDDSHPDTTGGETNRSDILKEIGDVFGVLDKMEMTIEERAMVDRAAREKYRKLDEYGPEGTYVKAKATG